MEITKGLGIKFSNSSNGGIREAVEILKRTKKLPYLHKVSPFAAWGLEVTEWKENSSLNSLQNNKISELPSAFRKLIAVSNHIFKSSYTETSGLDNILQYSQEYREALDNCCIQLEMEYVDTSSAIDDRVIELLKIAISLWHLCELLFLQVKDTSELYFDIAIWLQQYYCGSQLEILEANANNLLQSTEFLPNHTLAFTLEAQIEYWPTIYGLILYGQGSKAWRLLARHPRATQSVYRTTFQKLKEILITLPCRPHQSKEWREKCHQILANDAIIQSDKNLRTLMQLISGDKELLKEYSSSWYELMMGYLFFHPPSTNITHGLEFLMVQCYEQMNGTQEMEEFDIIILTCFQRKLLNALQDIYALGFTWMTAHLTDLFVKYQLVAEEIVDEVGCSLREYFLLCYVLECWQEKHGMWEIIVQYLEYCPRFGGYGIRSILERENVETEVKARQLIRYCQSMRVLDAVKDSIILRRTNACISKKRFGAAMLWLLQNNQLEHVDTLCETVLEICEKEQSFLILHDAVEFQSRHTDFKFGRKFHALVWYRELLLIMNDHKTLKKELTQSEQVSLDDNHSHRLVAIEAAKRIEKLAIWVSTPRRLRIPILQQLKVLLHEEQSVFTSDQLHRILGFLQAFDRVMDPKEKELLKSEQVAALKFHVRKLVVKNLQQTMVNDMISGRI